MKNVFFIALSFLFLAACQNSTDELNSTETWKGISHRSDKVRAFQGSIDGTLDFESEVPPTACTGVDGFYTAEYYLDGQAIPLGNIDEELSNLHHESCDLNLATMLLTAVVSGQIVAADGDVIYYTGLDTVNVFNYVTGAGPNGPISGTWTIEGGTGRFDDATGTFRVNGLVDFSDLSFDVDAQGTITY